MGRYRFQDDDDDECDDSPRQQSNHNSWGNNRAEDREDGEIIEDESHGSNDEMEMDCSDDRCDDSYQYNNNKYNNNEDRSRWELEPRTAIEDEDGFEGGGRSQSYASYFPSISRFTGRGRNRNEDENENASYGNQSPDRPWFRRGRSPRDEAKDINIDYYSKDDDNNDRNYNAGSDKKEGDEEYRLIASSRYHRNYDRSDFYPTGNQSSYGSSGSYATNAVSDDDEHVSPSDQNRKNNNNRDRGGGTRYDSSGNQQQLTRSSSSDVYQHRSHKNPAPEIHYHIYVSEKQASRLFPSIGDDSGGSGQPARDDDDDDDDDDSPHRQTPTRSTPLWKKVVTLALMVQLMLMMARRFDLGVSPPPPYLSWEEYKSHKFVLVRRLSREGCSLLKHVTTSTARRIARRGSDLPEDNDENSGPLPPRFDFPEVWASFVTKRSFTKANASSNSRRTFGGHDRVVLFGQDAALEHLRHGLNTWSFSRQKKNRHEAHHSRSSQPLVVYASGGKGVGKRSLVYLLLEQLVHLQGGSGETTTPDRDSSIVVECASAAERVSNPAEESPGEVPLRKNYCPLLHLTPSEYQQFGESESYDDDNAYRYQHESCAMDEVGGERECDTAFLKLYQRIVDHVVAAGGGASIVALDRVDCSSCSTDVDATGNCGCVTGSDPASMDDNYSSWLRELMARVRSEPAVFGNTVFVLTSHVGTATVEKWTRKRLQSLSTGDQGGRPGDFSKTVAAAGAPEVDSLLRYEIKKHHATTSRTGGHAMIIDDWLLVPMAPLDRSSLASILGHIASTGRKTIGRFGRTEPEGLLRSLVVSEEAAGRLLDALEWHQWIHKTSGDVLRAWSPDGATPLWKLWEERILDPISQLSGCPLTSWPLPSSSEALVLDLEEDSADRFVLRSCVVVGDDKNSGLTVTSMDDRAWKCRKSAPSQARSCSFYL